MYTESEQSNQPVMIEAKNVTMRYRMAILARSAQTA